MEDMQRKIDNSFKILIILAVFFSIILFLLTLLSCLISFFNVYLINFTTEIIDEDVLRLSYDVKTQRQLVLICKDLIGSEHPLVREFFNQLGLVISSSKDVVLFKDNTFLADGGNLTASFSNIADLTQIQKDSLIFLGEQSEMQESLQRCWNNGQKELLFETIENYFILHKNLDVEYKNVIFDIIEFIYSSS